MTASRIVWFPHGWREKGPRLGRTSRKHVLAKQDSLYQLGDQIFTLKFFTLISTYGIGEKKLHFGTFRIFLIFFSLVPIRVSFFQFCDVAKLDIAHMKI
jgi:hypothetical protein